MLALGQFAEVRRNLRLALSPSPRPVYPCMGRILSRGCRKGPIHFFVPQFLCSTWQPFLRPDPPHPASPARAGTVKAGAGLSAAHPKGLGLDGSEHDGTLAVVGMTMPEEEPACGARRFVPHPCMRWVQRPEP
jgi:hypothetical protein